MKAKLPIESGRDTGTTIGFNGFKENSQPGTEPATFSTLIRRSIPIVLLYIGIRSGKAIYQSEVYGFTDREYIKTFSNMVCQV